MVQSRDNHKLLQTREHRIACVNKSSAPTSVVSNGESKRNFSNDFFRNIDAMIYTCGYENCAPGHSYGPILRNGYLIHYVLGGCGIYKARGRLFRLNAGDAFLICPGELIYYEADGHAPWSYTWIGMQGIKVAGYLERTTLPGKLIVHYGADDELRRCHEKMFEADKLPRNRDLMMNRIMYEYLYLLARKFPNERALRDEKKSDYVEEALNFIEGRYCDPITIQEIADHLNINRTAGAMDKHRTIPVIFPSAFPSSLLSMAWL